MKHKCHLGEGGIERVETAHLILEVFRRPKYPGIVKSNPSRDGGKVCHNLRKTSPEEARFLVRKVLEQNGGNV